MQYLDTHTSKLYMIHNEGNEWKNPESAGLEEQLKSDLEKMLRDRAKAVGVDDKMAEGLTSSFNSIYSMQVEPGLKSMLTDINQYNAPEKKLQSRTDDLSPVLHLGRYSHHLWYKQI